MTSRLRYMDSVRGLASMVVVWSHFVLGFGLPGILEGMENTPLHIFWDGFASVSMFFVLSGFVLSYKHFNPGIATETAEFNFRVIMAFYIKRIFRICLPFVFFLFVSFFCHQLFYEVYPTDPVRTPWLYGLWENVSLTLWDMIKQAVLVIPGTFHCLVPQAWTLSLEMQFSLLMPFMLVFARYSMRGFILLGIVLVFIDLSLPMLRGTEISMMLACFFHFYLGILMSRYFRCFSTGLSGTSIYIKTLLLVGGLILYSFRFSIYPRSFTFFSDQTIPYFTGFGSFLLLILFSGTPFLQTVLAIPFFHYLGKISYSLYLCHIIVLMVLLPRFIHFMNLYHVDGTASFFLSFVTTTIFCILIAGLSYHFIEQPFVKIGRLCKDRITNVKPSEAGKQTLGNAR